MLSVFTASISRQITDYFIRHVTAQPREMWNLFGSGVQNKHIAAAQAAFLYGAKALALSVENVPV